MSHPPGRKKMAKIPRRLKRPRICIDSLPTNCSFQPINYSSQDIIRSFQDLNMSRSNLSCESCVCSEEEGEDFQTPCCESLRCRGKVRLEQEYHKPDPSCPVCSKSLNKATETCDECNDKGIQRSSVNNVGKTVPCVECNKDKTKEVEHCPQCQARKEKAEQNPDKCQQTPKVNKDLRCPSCSQPLSIQMACCDPSSKPVVMIIPEKLLKEITTATYKDDDLEDTKKEPRRKKEADTADCTQRCEIKQPELKINRQASIPCCDKIPCTTDSKLIQPLEPEPAEKIGKVKDNKVICSEKCKNMKEDPDCSCVYPPAYKQYSCIGRISGTCECKKGKEKKRNG